MSWQLRAENWSEYKLLMRLDKPIGSYLLLWPTWWALWLASSGQPSLGLVVIFSLGVFLMRSAGCVINDYADRHFDGHVERTKSRPLAAGRVQPAEALQLFIVLVCLAALLLTFLNWQTKVLSLVAVALAALYPFMKRFTYLPQFVLGAAYSWGIPMAAMATLETVPLWVWVLYFANLLWTVAYDTFYAMVDRDDDIRIGIKSTALLFGQHCHSIIAGLQLAFLALMVGVGVLTESGLGFYAGLFAMALTFIYQHSVAYRLGRAGCFQAFLHNHYSGLLLFIGIALDALLR